MTANATKEISKLRIKKMPIRVELTGVTGVGKTTIVPELKAELSRRGSIAEEVDTALLKFYGWDWIEHPKVRSLLIHLLALFPGLAYISTPPGRQLWKLVWRNVRAESPRWGLKLYMLRNCLMKIGVNARLDRLENRLKATTDGIGLPWDFILIDEGTLHLAHTLFVRDTSPPNAEEIQQFGQLVPQPDIVIWVTSDPEKSIQCTLNRGHKRVYPSLEAASRFVEFAYRTFRMLLTSNAISARVLEVDYSFARSNSEPSATQTAARIADGLQSYS